MNSKLLVTLGPNSMTEQVIRKMDEYGIYLFRINLSHTPFDQLEKVILKIRSFSKTPICLDSEGAQVRNQDMINGEVCYEEGERIRILFQRSLEPTRDISLTPADVAQQLRIGDVLNIDFHHASLRITEIHEDYCSAIVLSGGKVGSNKAVDVSRNIDLAPMSSKDEQAITLGLKMDIKHFALSFANCKSDVELFRSMIGEQSFLISKIESILGVKHMEEIMDHSDAILIDRGDLSRQVAIEKIPFFQREIVSLAVRKEKEVFVATNLLESMVVTKQPTRAEANDVVSTLEMGASGLVLAAETAIGAYPVECVEMISRLIYQYDLWAQKRPDKQKAISEALLADMLSK